MSEGERRLDRDHPLDMPMSRPARCAPVVPIGMVCDCCGYLPRRFIACRRLPGALPERAAALFRANRVCRQSALAPCPRVAAVRARHARPSHALPPQPMSWRSTPVEWTASHPRHEPSRRRRVFREGHWVILPRSSQSPASSGFSASAAWSNRLLSSRLSAATKGAAPRTNRGICGCVRYECQPP